MAGKVKSLVSKLRALPPDNQLRARLTTALLEKLYAMGLITTASSLELADRLTAAAFCRRRLPVVLVRLKMCETVSQAVQYVEHGHIRVGPEVVTDPAYLVTRSFEDYVTWVDTSKIKRAVAAYNDKLDDFDLLGL